MSSPSSGQRPPNPLDRFTSGGWVKGILRFSVGVALVAAVLRFAGGDSWRRLLSPALLPVIGAGALVHLVQRAARIRKWQLMIAPTRVIQRSYTYLLRVQLIGMIANLALPVSEAVKVWAVSRDRADVRVSAKSIVVELCIHTCLVGAVGVVSAIAASWWEPVVWAVSLTILIGPLVVMAVARRWPATPATDTAHVGGAIIDDHPKVWAWAVLETLCQVSLYVIAFKAIGVRVALVQVLALAPVLYIVDLANFTPSGLGLREALFAGVLVVMPNVSADIGVATALVISSMLLLATLVGGGLALLLPAPSEDT